MSLNFKNVSQLKASFQSIKQKTTKQYIKCFISSLVVSISGIGFLSLFLQSPMLVAIGISITMFGAIGMLIVGISSVVDRVWTMPVAYAQEFSTLFFKHKPSIFSSHEELIVKECDFIHYQLIKDFFDFYINYKLQVQQNIKDTSDLKEIKSLIDFNILSLQEEQIPLKVKTLIKQNHIKIFEACDKALQEMYNNKSALDLVNNDLDQEALLFELEKQEQKAKEFIANIYEKMPKHTQEEVIKHNKHLAL